MATESVRKVPCPTCRASAVYGPANPWRPFCSERCRSMDLGAWATEQFRVPAVNPPDSPEAAPDAAEGLSGLLRGPSPDDPRH